MAVVSFPERPKAAPTGASRLVIWRGRLRARMGSLLNACRVPGAVQSVSVDDAVPGQTLTVTVGARYVRVTVNGRDYYFDRITGRFDGTGSSLA